ncbi:MAG: glycosyltransferase [Acidobacteria bacterium]|nr:glycosyltransferase [Acidobacteriota bacterium]
MFIVHAAGIAARATPPPLSKCGPRNRLIESKLGSRVASSVCAPVCAEASFRLSQQGEPFIVEGGVNASVQSFPENSVIPQAQAPRLSVIVPVYNGKLQLPRCLDALRISDFTGFEVIVVDDCSTDNTRQIVERFRARYLRTPRQLGPGGGRNLGVRHARGEILVFVDADVVVAPDTLGCIAADFDAAPDLAAVFGSYDEAPAWSDFLSQYKNLMHHYVHQMAGERASTFWAGCGAIRKDVFLEFGGFDTERYPNPSIEDIDLGFRISQAGRKILLDKKIQVKHLKKWTVRGLLRADIFYRAIPWTNLILETRNLPADLNLTFASRVSAVLVGLFVLGVLALPVAALGWLPWISTGSLLAALAAIALLLFVLNWRVYAWFAARRGWLFTLGAALAHWAYYFYSGAVFVLCTISHKLRGSPVDTRFNGAAPARLAGNPACPEGSRGRQE